MNRTIPLGHLGGIRVSMSPSVLLIAGFYVYILATYQFPNEVWGASSAAYWIAGIAGALAFFVCLLVHEMSHALAARRAHIGVRGITLWLLGGFAELEAEPRTPAQQFSIAAVGPLSNLVLAALFWGAHLALVDNPDPFSIGYGPGDLPGIVLGWLAFVNFLLGVFNLLPASPLDGGQLFCAGVWAASGNRSVARRWSAYAGIALGAIGAGFGLLSLGSNGSLNGMWLLFIGWWIVMVAMSELRRIGAEDVLRPVTVAHLMRPNPPVVSADWTIDAAIASRLITPDAPAACAQGPDGRIIGLLTAAQVRDCDPHSRASVPLGHLAFPIERVRCFSSEASALEVARMINDDPVGQALILATDGRVIGTIGVAEVDERLRRHRSGAPAAVSPGR